jgi:ADP-heptose:LPS heptosyltransferase
MTFRKALFIQIKMLGDILMLTPAIRAFKNKFPDTKLDLAVQSPGDVLLRNNPYVDNIIMVPPVSWRFPIKQLKVIGEFRRNHYDLAIDFLGNPRSAHFTYLTRAKMRVGYEDARFKYAYNKTSPRVFNYSAISKLNFISFLGIDTSNYLPELYLDDAVKLPPEMSAPGDRKLVAISPVSLREHKVWPTANFTVVAKYLADKYQYHPVVIVGPGEKRFLDEFARHAQTDYTPLYIDDLMQLGKAIKACHLFVGNDNGPKHIAVAMGLPTFTVYSHLINPIGWNYPDLRHHQYIGGTKGDKVISITDIPVTEAIVKIDEFIEQLN